MSHYSGRNITEKFGAAITGRYALPDPAIRGCGEVQSRAEQRAQDALVPMEFNDGAARLCATASTGDCKTCSSIVDPRQAEQKAKRQ